MVLGAEVRILQQVFALRVITSLKNKTKQKNIHKTITTKQTKKQKTPKQKQQTNPKQKCSLNWQRKLKASAQLSVPALHSVWVGGQLGTACVREALQRTLAFAF